MTQPRWADNRRHQLDLPYFELQADTIVNLELTARLGNRHTLHRRHKAVAASLLQDSTPLPSQDRWAFRFARSLQGHLRYGRNPTARQARSILTVIYHHHKDREVADLALGALESLGIPS